MSIEEIKLAIDAIGNSDEFQHLFWGDTYSFNTEEENHRFNELTAKMVELSKSLPAKDQETYHWLGWC